MEYHILVCTSMHQYAPVCTSMHRNSLKYKIFYNKTKFRIIFLELNIFLFLHFLQYYIFTILQFYILQFYNF